MDKAEFIRLCDLCGYSSMKVAKEYTDRVRKEIYTDDDFEAVTRMVDKMYVIREDRYYYSNGCFTMYGGMDEEY